MNRYRISIGLTVAVLVATLSAAPAQAEPNFLENVTASDDFYPAVAVLGVDIPTSFNFATMQFTGFDGVADAFFTVNGSVRIRSENPVVSFNDLLTGAAVGPVAAGRNLTVQQEIVDVTVDSIVGVGGSASTVVLGDGVSDNMDSGLRNAGDPRSYFSTGGAAMTALDATTANGFLNLFMEIDVTGPQIPVINLAPGLLHNEDPLQLTAVIEKYLPFGVPFNKIGGPVPLFTRTNSPINMALGIGTPLEAARFVEAQITIVPEPSSIIAGIFALVAFVGVVWAKRRRKIAA